MSAAENEVQESAQRAKTEYTTVDMEDGTKIDFAGKRKMLKSSYVDNEGNVVVRIDFRNGRIVKWAIPKALEQKAAGHGGEQKLGDNLAGFKGDDDDAVLETESLIERLNSSGEWNTVREGDGMAGTSILLRALVELAGGKKTVEQVKAWLKDKKPKEKIALRNDPKVKPIVARLEEEKAATGPKIDTGALLGDFEAA